MPERHLPRYPVYIPSKGRAARNLTADMFVHDETPFRLVIEEPEYDEYAVRYGEDRLLVLPFVDRGLVAARNWIRDHAEEEGHARHWQFDDNIRKMMRIYRNRRLYVRAGVALAVCEDFTDRYSNVAISGFNYTMFAPVETKQVKYPFVRNCHVYSCSLINHEQPYRWRRVYNDDTDICLQVLAGGWCTILLNAFLVDKMPTMTVAGGNLEDLYQYTDGRLKMARSLERDWPGVVDVRRRFKRPQHVVKGSWKHFDTPLIRRDDWEPPEDPEYGMTLTARAEVKSPSLRKLLKDANE
jgi:hypothetical protein